MKHSIQAVALSTENRTQILRNKYKFSKAHGNPFVFDDNTINKIEERGYIPQYLYITISQEVEPIKEGDWCYDWINETVFQFKHFNSGVLHSDNHSQLEEHCRKIIATTDPKLTFSHTISGYEFHKFKKPIPQVQQSFLKEYVANPDGEFEVEYREGTWELAGTMEDIIFKTLTDPNYPPIKPGTVGYALLINQDNTVNITSVEDKTLA